MRRKYSNWIRKGINNLYGFSNNGFPQDTNDFISSAYSF